MHLDEDFWSLKYRKGETGWDTGGITTPLRTYFDQIEDKSMSILIPGCGNAYEAEYLFQKGFENISLVDISIDPLRVFKFRVPDFPEDHLLHRDFFDLKGSWDLVIEQTFFCAIDPSLRNKYAEHCKQIIKPGGKLVGVLFDDPLFDNRPPFGGSKEDYLPIFEPHFEIKVFERCYNSIRPRKGRELFINLINAL